ncbi:MAG: hypothetical protein ABR575_03160 [Actinomycetota bacterium]
MTATAVRPTEPARRSAELGLVLRKVLLAPDDGFRSAAAVAGRRRRAGVRPVEGRAPRILALVGGASLMLLWLKLGALLGVRSVTAGDYRVGYLVAAVVLGGVLGLLAQLLWAAAVFGPVIARLGGSVQAAELRLVWGAASFPLALGSVVLLPIDLVLAGPGIFTSERLGTVATAWAALSIALSVSIAVWWLFLLFKGTRAVAGLGGRHAAWTTAAALGSLAITVVAFWGIGLAARGWV